jgi:hypothetical protein
MTGIFLTLMALCLAIGLTILVGVVASATLWRFVQPKFNPASTQEITAYIVAGAILIVAIVAGIKVASLLLRTPDEGPKPNVNDLYDIYLVGIGYGLVLLALLNFVALAGFAKVGILHDVLDVNFAAADSDANPLAGVHRMLFLLLLPGFAVLGALFFHANSLRAKREDNPDEAAGPKSNPSNPDSNPPVAARVSLNNPAAGAINVVEGEVLKPKEVTDIASQASGIVETGKSQQAKLAVQVTPIEPFSAARFWGGLWYRVGEAMLFALVILLFVAGSGGAAPSGVSPKGPMVLLAALLLGMFVKAAESLISGLADKLFASIKAFVK